VLDAVGYATCVAVQRVLVGQATVSSHRTDQHSLQALHLISAKKYSLQATVCSPAALTPVVKLLTHDCGNAMCEVVTLTVSAAAAATAR
jgi:hypothetical protein